MLAPLECASHSLRNAVVRHRHVLEQDVKSHETVPTSLTKFWTSLANTCQAILVESFPKVIESIPRSVADVIKTRGGRTRHRKVGGGRPRTTTAGDDLYIIMQVKRGRQQSASVIAQQLSTATGRQVSRFTVARRLHKGRIRPPS
ncbi:transposable element Tcb2 transposase [Trichonephila clavipes]|nr:transposable element Tcb2 transposase [Trichonephila clavipes]